MMGAVENAMGRLENISRVTEKLRGQVGVVPLRSSIIDFNKPSVVIRRERSREPIDESKNRWEWGGE